MTTDPTFDLLEKLRCTTLFWPLKSSSQLSSFWQTIKIVANYENINSKNKASTNQTPPELPTTKPPTNALPPITMASSYSVWELMTHLHLIAFAFNTPLRSTSRLKVMAFSLNHLTWSSNKIYSCFSPLLKTVPALPEWLSAALGSHPASLSSQSYWGRGLLASCSPTQCYPTGAESDFPGRPSCDQKHFSPADRGT